jgi:serine protease inhibitor
MSHRYDSYNPIHKDKMNLTIKSNTRYNDRNMLDIELKKGLVASNLDRMDIERDSFMKSSYYDDTQSNDSQDNFGNNIRDLNVGEISNDSFDRFDVNLERGMPYRSQVNIRKNLHEQNMHPEYLLRKKNDPVKEMKPFNSFTSQTTNNLFSDIGESTKISESSKIDTMCTDNINTLSIFFVKNLLKILSTPFVISSVDIYSVFSSLYVASKGNTEIELKNYFEFPRKDLLVNGYMSILEDLEHNRTHVKNGSCILFDNNNPVNPSFCKYIENISKVRKVNKNSIHDECLMINNIISQITQNEDMKKSITKSSLENINTLLLTYSYINPTLLINNFQQIQTGFLSKFAGHVNVNYLVATDQIFGYSEHNNLRILELCCENSEVMYGIVNLQGRNGEVDFNKQDMLTSIKKLKPVLFNKIQFPLFNIKTKLKLKNVLKKTDLVTVFLDLNCPELFSEKTKLDDLLQNCEIKLEAKTKRVKMNVDYKSDKNFIVDKSFVYYLRLRKSNTIFSIGYF